MHTISIIIDIVSEKNMKIQVYGTNCPVCKQMFERTKQIVSDLKIEAELEYIDDIQKMIELGMIASPVLVIDEKVALSGKNYTDKNLEDAIKGKSKDLKNSTSDCACSCC